MDLKNYYEQYWIKRKEDQSTEPIRSFIPKFLVKYSSYGAISNQIPENSTVLDIGCGDGNVSALYIKKQCKVTGIDVSNNALEIASRRGVDTIQWDLNTTPLPIPADFFDVAIISDVLEHVIDPNSLLKEAHRRLKNQGILILYIPNFARIGNRIRMLAGDPRDILHWKGYGDEIEHLHWFTKPKLTYLLTQAGFEDIKFIPTGLPFGFIYGLVGCHSLSNYLLIRCTK